MSDVKGDAIPVNMLVKLWTQVSTADDINAKGQTAVFKRLF
jgi:hypothetical protein